MGSGDETSKTNVSPVGAVPGDVAGAGAVAVAVAGAVAVVVALFWVVVVLVPSVGAQDQPLVEAWRSQ